MGEIGCRVMPLTERKLEEERVGKEQGAGEEASGKGPAHVWCLRVEGREDTEVMESVKAPGTLS